MTSRKKLIISLSVAAAVLVAAIIAVVAVFAASQQVVKSNITIKFTASDVSCTVGAKYKVENKDAIDLGTVTINAKDEENKEYSLSPTGNVDLTKTNNSVTFEWTFTNTGSKAFTIKLNQLTNISGSAFNVKFYTNDGSDDTEIDRDKLAATGVNVESVSDNGKAIIKMVVTMPAENMGNDAELSLNMEWTLDTGVTVTPEE